MPIILWMALMELWEMSLVISTFYYINQYKIIFTDVNFIIYPVLASLVFYFFNFRKKQNVLQRCRKYEHCFFGISWLGLLVVKTRSLLFIYSS